MTDLHTWWDICGDFIYNPGWGTWTISVRNWECPQTKGTKQFIEPLNPWTESLILCPATEGQAGWIWAEIYKWEGRKAALQSDPNKTASGRWCERRRFLHRGRHFWPYWQKSASNCCAVTHPQHTDAYKAPLIKGLVVSHKKRTCNLPFNPP